MGTATMEGELKLAGLVLLIIAIFGIFIVSVATSEKEEPKKNYVVKWVTHDCDRTIYPDGECFGKLRTWARFDLDDTTSEGRPSFVENISQPSCDRCDGELYGGVYTPWSVIAPDSVDWDSTYPHDETD